MKSCEKPWQKVNPNSKEHRLEDNTPITKATGFYRTLLVAAAALFVNTMAPNPGAPVGNYSKGANSSDTSRKFQRLPSGCFWGGSGDDGTSVAIHCYVKREIDKKDENRGEI